MSNTKMVVSIGHRMVTVVGDEGWCKGCGGGGRGQTPTGQ